MVSFQQPVAASLWVTNHWPICYKLLAVPFPRAASFLCTLERRVRNQAMGHSKDQLLARLQVLFLLPCCISLFFLVQFDLDITFFLPQNPTAMFNWRCSIPINHDVHDWIENKQPPLTKEMKLFFFFWCVKWKVIFLDFYGLGKSLAYDLLRVCNVKTFWCLSECYNVFIYLNNQFTRVYNFPSGRVASYYSYLGAMIKFHFYHIRIFDKILKFLWLRIKPMLFGPNGISFSQC